jgi:hypothetical protein
MPTITLNLIAPGATRVRGIRRINGRNFPLPVAKMDAGAWQVIMTGPAPMKVRFATTNAEGKVDQTPHKPAYRSAGRSGTINLAVRPLAATAVIDDPAEAATAVIDDPAEATPPADVLVADETPLQAVVVEQEEAPLLISEEEVVVEEPSGTFGVLVGLVALVGAGAGGFFWWRRRGNNGE